MEKRASAAGVLIPAALGLGGFAWKSGLKNLGEFGAVMNIGKVRRFIGTQGNALVRSGFRDALQGKRVRRYGVTSLATATAAGAAPMTMYEQGHELGQLVKNVSHTSGIDPYKLLRGVQRSDTAVQDALRTAPYSGAAIGAARDVAQERHNKPEDRHYGNAAVAGAVKGGLLGAGVRRFFPHAAGIRHLHDLRVGQVDTLLGDGEMKRIEKIFARAAKPEVMRPRRNVAAEAFKKGLSGEGKKEMFLSGTNRAAQREGLAAGKGMRRRVDGIPGLTPEKAHALVPKVDDLLQKTLSRAPFIGAGAGAAADVNAERKKRPERRRYARAAGTGALKGGLLGAAVGHFAPHTEPVKKLQDYRKKFFG